MDEKGDDFLALVNSKLEYKMKRARPPSVSTTGARGQEAIVLTLSLERTDGMLALIAYLMFWFVVFYVLRKHLIICSRSFFWAALP